MASLGHRDFISSWAGVTGNDVRPEMLKDFEYSVVAQTGAPYQPQRGQAVT